MARLDVLLTGYDITDEVINRASSTPVRLDHDTIRGTADLEIWTGAGGTGTQLALTTDYTVSDEDTDLTTEAGIAIYTKLAIVNGVYQNTDLYVTYKTIGDYGSVNTIEHVIKDIGIESGSYDTKYLGADSSSLDDVDKIEEIMSNAGTNEVIVTEDYNVETRPINTYGASLSGKGKILLGGTDGHRINTYVDKYQRVCGMEYLSSIHNKIKTSAVPATKYKVLLSGDSTTAQGWFESFLTYSARSKGINCLEFTNVGHSGASTEQWRDTYLASDISADPDVYILRWGINDGSLHGSVDRFLTALREGLATFRATHSKNNCSVILMSPSPVSDDPNGRNETWMESIIPGIKEIAREYLCTYIDTYGYIYDARNADDWMDDPYSDGRHIHPLTDGVGYGWIASLMSDVLIPEWIGYIYGAWPTVQNIPGTYETRASTVLAELFQKGVGIFRSGAGFPEDGAVVNIRHSDGITSQFNWSYLSTWASLLFRQTKSDGSWTTFARLTPNTPPSSVVRATNAALPSTYEVGFSAHRTDSPLTFPIDGGVFTLKAGDLMALQFNIGYSVSVVDIRVRQAKTTDDTWTPWKTITLA